ncbi:hypothetical protein E3N88_36865 [Mikania micrantha]|uniref:CCHC-type domain-containing protein n=1 Tax=Mikania micrantha TaxID=192012 RepID=A0A5N6M501_9ASTR|nr:hypothetical protein E3N88_36865 [Mikania micrantha]
MKKCKCYVCGKEGHFARECKSKMSNVERTNAFQNLDLPDNYDVLSVDQDEPESDAICSMSEGEQTSFATLMEEWAFVVISEEVLSEQVLSEEAYVTTIKESSWRPEVKLPEDQELCFHNWKKEKPKEKENCKLCRSDVRQNIRGKCEVCDLIVCMLCLKAYYDEVIQISPKPPTSSTNELVNELKKHCLALQQEVDRLGQIIQDDEKIVLERERLQLEETEVPEEVQEETIALTQSTQQNPRTERRNKLYNLKVYFKIPGVEEFEIPAIIDTVRDEFMSRKWRNFPGVVSRLQQIDADERRGLQLLCYEDESFGTTPRKNTVISYQPFSLYRIQYLVAQRLSPISKEPMEIGRSTEIHDEVRRLLLNQYEEILGHLHIFRAMLSVRRIYYETHSGGDNSRGEWRSNGLRSTNHMDETIQEWEAQRINLTHF